MQAPMKAPQSSLGAIMVSFLFVTSLVAAVAPPFIDDFNDGNDVGWDHYDPLAGLGAGGVGTWSFPNGAYRLQATGAQVPGQTGPARVGSFTDLIYAEFEMQFEVVAWATNLDQLFGAIARVQQAGLGTTDGYIFSYDMRNGRGPTGRVEIQRVTDERGTTLASVDLTLLAGRQYRFTFSGYLNQFRGQIFDVTNTTQAVATLTASDGTYASGYVGIFIYDNSNAETQPVDFTVDNFSVFSPRPTLDIRIQPDNESIMVRWPTWAASYALESTVDFVFWDDANFNIQTNGDMFEHTDFIDQTRFYRLVSR